MEKEVTLNSLATGIKELSNGLDSLARSVATGFEAVRVDMQAVKEDMQASKEDMQGMEKRLSTRIASHAVDWDKVQEKYVEEQSDHGRRINILEDSVFVQLGAKYVPISDKKS